MLWILGYLASILMGLSLGLIGGGGSILTVPILVYLFSLSPVLATSYSLFLVGFTALVGGLFFYSRGQVDLKLGGLFALPSLIGVYLVRLWLLPQMPEIIFRWGSWELRKSAFIMLVFSVLMVLAAISMLVSARRSQSTTSGGDLQSSASLSNPKAEIVSIKSSTGLSLRNSVLVLLEGLLVGGVTGLVGAGGGFLIIPALVVLVGIPLKRAVGTSLFIISAKSLVGFVGDLQSGVEVQWFFLSSILGLSLGGLFVGMWLSKFVSEAKLKLAFAFFILVMGAFVFYDQL